MIGTGGVSGPGAFDLTFGSVRSAKGQMVEGSLDANSVANWPAVLDDLPLGRLVQSASRDRVYGAQVPGH